MLEWLVGVGAVEVGKAVFEQGLKLSQDAAADYVKDFFKDCLKEGLALGKPEVTKKAVASALKEFLSIVVEELEDKGLSGAEIRDRYYERALVQFVQDDAVKPLLGRAFEKDCQTLDTGSLAKVWARSSFKGKPFPAMPHEFDWAAVGRLYLKKVRRIVRETPELRALLEMDLLEQQTESLKQLAGINPGFDVAQYRQSLQCSYGALKLHTLDSTDRADPMKLWNMFIEQTVREALPPLRYEVPLDVKRQLQAEGGLEGDLSPEDLAHYRQEYFQQPARKVLAAIGDSPKAMILGDPGAGKSTLLQYLALQWVEGAALALPLLIELREYALAGVNGFLEFLHRGRSADWQFDPQQLHQHLLEQPTIVMFDGLDEVFDRATQGTIVDEIVRFGQMYPLAQVLVTSRIIGYNPERLQQADFKQFTIQPLDREETDEFIDRWYDLALGADADKARLVTRLKDAIANSKAIQNLADNPLLLTMMAILNRRQELPRDRADLYDQASRVLLYHWDVDHKRLQLPMDTIGRREKQEMLRLIAYEMQTSEEGLKGNLIRADRLVRILTDYLRDQGFEGPREKANGLIEQLRHRNWILCDRGADTYGFVHRTFLEYFCAMEIVHRFEKARTLTFEQLRDEVFGGHWQDETWHEVLRLICGAIDTKFAAQLIESLIDINTCNDFSNVFLSSECILEIKNGVEIESIFITLMSRLKNLSQYGEVASLNEQRTYNFQETREHELAGNIRCKAVKSLGSVCKGKVETLIFLQEIAKTSSSLGVRQDAIGEIAKSWRNLPEVLIWLKQCLQDSDQDIRHAVVRELARGWRDCDDVLCLLKDIAKSDSCLDVRRRVLFELRSWRKDSRVFEMLYYSAQNDIAPRRWDTDINVRQTALETLLTHYPTHPKTLELLHDRALNDPDDQLRTWAQAQLKLLEANP
jgi:NACHT domain/HEAT repeats